VGATMLLFLAGLQSIPTSIYEASEIDGINWWQKFYQITIPMLTPTIFYVVIVNVIGSWQVFTAAFVMTEGGPNYATLFYVLYLYQHAFRWLNMGYASALAWVLFIIILTSTFLLFKSSSKWVYYEAKRK
ncbi:unnamed protein product, partial [marine sediment metagenome]